MALYTIANPNIWLQPESIDANVNRSTFWAPKGTTVDANYGLVPFWKDENTFWTSEQVRNNDVFGYAYPETQYWNFLTDEEWRNDVRGTIQKLYPSSARATFTNAIARGSDLSHLVEEGNTFVDWAIEAKASAKEMPASFKAHFSLVGDFSSDKSIEVGMWARMTTGDHDKGAWKDHQRARREKRHSTMDQSLSNTQSLTSDLLTQIADSKLESLDPTVVVPYLKRHLTWNVFAVHHGLSCSLIQVN